MKLLIVDDSNIVRSRIARVVQRGALGPVTIVGLDIVAALVRELGARLSLSTRRGQGTAFHVRLQG